MNYISNFSFFFFFKSKILCFRTENKSSVSIVAAQMVDGKSTVVGFSVTDQH